MKLIFSKVAGFQQFFSLRLAGEFRAGFFLGRFCAAANGLLRQLVVINKCQLPL